MVEEMILNMAKNQQLPGKLGEEQLITLLESLNQQTQRKTTVKVSNYYSCASNNRIKHYQNFILFFQFDRRRAALDSDDDMDL